MKSKDEARVTVVNKYPTHQIITELHRLAAGNVSEQAVAMPLDDQYLLTDGHRTLVDSATVNISDESSEMSTLAKCRGKQGVSVAIPIVKVSMNSCVIKKFLDIVEDADGIAGAIAGIAALIKKNTWDFSICWSNCRGNVCW